MELQVMLTYSICVLHPITLQKKHIFRVQLWDMDM